MSLHTALFVPIKGLGQFNTYSELINTIGTFRGTG